MDLDDWEMEEYIPVIQSEKTKKRLEERKKVEESDLNISKGLFSDPEINEAKKPKKPKKPKKSQTKEAKGEQKNG